MPNIHIHRPHQLGLSAARSVAHTWARKAEAKFGLACVYEEGPTQDVLHFSRAGVQGTLQVQADQFELAAELGFLFGAFQGRIEAEITAQLDKLLDAQPQLQPPAPDSQSALAPHREKSEDRAESTPGTSLPASAALGPPSSPDSRLG